MWSFLRERESERERERERESVCVCERERGEKEREKGSGRERERTKLVGALSPVSHKGLHHGWKQMSIHLLPILHRGNETAKFFKIHKINLGTNMKQNTQTSNTNFRRNSRFDTTLLKKKAYKARICSYRGLSSHLLISDLIVFFLKMNGQTQYYINA